MSDLDLQLSHLEFQGDSEIEISPPHAPSSQRSAGRASNSFTALLSQNEDLAARLRVTLQRLSKTEDANETLQGNIEILSADLQSFQDQILIWKEKEKIWKEKEANLEKRHFDRERELEIESSLLRQKAEQHDLLIEKVLRHERYQEKIKTSVKPYVARLKSYAEALLEETRNLNSQILQKEALLLDQEQKISALKSSNEQIEAKVHAERNQLISMFEDERESLKHEIQNLTQINETLIEKTRTLDRSIERQDELENLVVALRRTKEDQSKTIEQLTLGYKEKQKNTEEELTVKRLQFADLTKENQHLRSHLEQSESTQSQLEEQLISLRYMWTQKSQEAEQMKLSLQSLEKINHELSQKLNSLRKEFEISN